MPKSDVQTAADRRASGAAPWVLLVDDDLAATRAMSRTLVSRFSVRVRSASNLSGAMSCLRAARTQPCAVVLDYELAGQETGVDVLRAVRSQGFSSPCVFWTGAAGLLRRHLVDKTMTEQPLIFDKGSELECFLGWVTRAVRVAVANGDGMAFKTCGSGIRRKVVTTKEK